MLGEKSKLWNDVYNRPFMQIQDALKTNMIFGFTYVQKSFSEWGKDISNPREILLLWSNVEKRENWLGIGTKEL